MSDSEIKRLVHSRKYIRAQVTQSYNARDEISSLSLVEREELRTKLSSYRTKLEKYDEPILNSLWSSDSTDSAATEAAYTTELASAESYMNKLDACIARLTVTAAAEAAPAAAVAPPAAAAAAAGAPVTRALDAARSLLKSPVAPLPKYSGAEGEDLTRFLHELEETTSKHNYPEYDKFLLLKQQLSGRALILLNSLEITNQSYKKAVDLLKSALESPILRKFNVLKQLTELNLAYDKDPFEFISKFRNLSESFSLLKIDTDCVMQYFFWIGLNETFQKQFIQLTNETRPALKTLNDRFFEACERYSTVVKFNKLILIKINRFDKPLYGTNISNCFK